MWERAGLPKAARKENFWDRGPAAAEARVADSNAAEIAKLEDGIEQWVIRNERDWSDRKRLVRE